MTEFTQTIKDYDGNEVKVGSKVMMPLYGEAPPEPRDIGEVIEISDFDGDADDEGRSIIIPPDIKVKFPDGSVETYVTSEWEYTEGGWVPDEDGDPEPGWNLAEGKVEELLVVKDD